MNLTNKIIITYFFKILFPNTTYKNNYAKNNYISIYILLILFSIYKKPENYLYLHFSHYHLF